MDRRARRCASSRRVRRRTSRRACSICSGAAPPALVWTSPLPGDAAAPLRYIDLTGGVKPYLLTTVSNNLGATADADLRALDEVLPAGPRRRHAVADAAAVPRPRRGAACRPKTPSAARATSRSTAITTASTTASSANSAASRASTRSTPTPCRPQSGIGTFTATPADGRQATIRAPAGAARAPGTTPAPSSSARTSPPASPQEYWARRPQGAAAGGTTILPTARPAREELREACRALRGRVLREEVYAPGRRAGSRESVRDERTPLRGRPAAARRPRARLRRLLRLAAREHSPVTTSATRPIRASPTISRWRSTPTATSPAGVGRLPARDPAYPEQAATWVRYSEADFTNVADRSGLVPARGADRNARLPAHRRPAAKRTDCIDPTALAARAAAAARYPLRGRHPTGGSPSAACSPATRTIYRRDDLSAPLPLGQVESPRAASTRPTRCATPRAARPAVRGTKLSAAGLRSAASGAGAFVDLDGDGNHWAPSAGSSTPPIRQHPDACLRARTTSTCRRARSTPGERLDASPTTTTTCCRRDPTDAVGNTTLRRPTTACSRPG